MDGYIYVYILVNGDTVSLTLYKAYRFLWWDVGIALFVSTSGMLAVLIGLSFVQTTHLALLYD